MKELLEKIQILADEERVRASEKHGAAFNSMHEAYAVIKEELEEAEECKDAFIELMKYLWTCIKADRDDMTNNNCLRHMKRYANHTAAEWVQVIAMCDKAVQEKESQPAEPASESLPRWRAKSGDEYYFVTPSGKALITFDVDSEEDNLRYDFGNYFRTKDEANAAAQKWREVFGKGGGEA